MLLLHPIPWAHGFYPSGWGVIIYHYWSGNIVPVCRGGAASEERFWDTSTLPTIELPHGGRDAKMRETH